MKERLEITEWAKAALLFHEDRTKILDLCLSQPRSIKELSEEMGLNPGSIHNHVKKLHEAGMLEIVERRMINGIEEKKYAKAAVFLDLSKIKGEDLEKRNDKISHDVKKRVKKILQADPSASVKSQRAKLSDADVEYVRKELHRLRDYILQHHDESLSQETTLLFALGKEEES